MKAQDGHERRKQIAIGAIVILGLGIGMCGILSTWGYLPGVLGEWAGTIIGAITSPFLMEAFLVICGFFALIGINHWRHKKEGDEFVQLELLERETPSLLAQAEGAMAIGDTLAAAEYLAQMSTLELHQPETLSLRLELAKSTGKQELAAQLEKEIQKQKNQTKEIPNQKSKRS